MRSCRARGRSQSRSTPARRTRRPQLQQHSDSRSVARRHQPSAASPQGSGTASRARVPSARLRPVGLGSHPPHSRQTGNALGRGAASAMTQIAALGTSLADADVSARVSLTAVPTGAQAGALVAARVSGSDYFGARLKHFAEITTSLARRGVLACGLPADRGAGA
jgi:hypothetical protein